MALDIPNKPCFLKYTFDLPQVWKRPYFKQAPVFSCCRVSPENNLPCCQRCSSGLSTTQNHHRDQYRLVGSFSYWMNSRDIQGNCCNHGFPGSDVVMRHLHRTDYWTFLTWPLFRFTLMLWIARNHCSSKPKYFWGVAARAFLGVDTWCTLDAMSSNLIFSALPEAHQDKINRHIGSSRGKIEKGYVALDSGWQRGRQAGRYRNNSLSSW